MTLNEELPDAEYDIQILPGAPPVERNQIVRVGSGTPTLFRHERMISLPQLPYYRSYALRVSPQYDTELLRPLAGESSPDRVFAERRPSLLAARRAMLLFEKVGEVIRYHFRLFLTRQGDLLTPAEVPVAAELDLAEPTANRTLLGSTRVLAADLPDLDCQYQILWRLPDGGAQGDPVYAELADILMPGHPEWKAGANVNETPVLIRNRNGNTVVTLNDDPTPPSELHLPIKLWWPSPNARPVYVVAFDVKVHLPAGDLFKEPGAALLQLQRDGYRSRPLPISVLD
jgi:hypothetical protein